MTNEEIQRILKEQKDTSGIYKKSEGAINIAIANKEKAKDEEFSNKRQTALINYWKNEEHKKIRKEKLQQVSKTQKWIDGCARGRENLKNSDRYEQYRANQREGIIKKWQDPESSKKRKKQIKKALAKHWNDPEQRAAHVDATRRATAKPFMTPFGAFPSLAEAGKFRDKDTETKNGGRWMRYQSKRFPNEYYFLTWEEYDNLPVDKKQ
jgi:hypothetical protein